MSGIRSQLQRHTPLVAAACALLLLGAIVLSFFLWPSDDYERIQYQKMAYFYDLNTKELFEMPAGSPSPTETDSGPHNGMPAGVRAEVYCCGKYTGSNDYFVGLLEISTLAIPEEQRPKNLDRKDDRNYYLVRRPDEEKWHSVSSQEYQRILEEIRERCPDEPPQNVYPLPRPIR